MSKMVLGVVPEGNAERLAGREAGDVRRAFARMRDFSRATQACIESAASPWVRDESSNSRLDNCFGLSRITIRNAGTPLPADAARPADNPTIGGDHCDIAVSSAIQVQDTYEATGIATLSAGIASFVVWQSELRCCIDEVVTELEMAS